MWQQNQATSGSVFDAYVARYNGSAWQAPERVENRTDNAAQVNVAVDSLGNVSAAFLQNDGTANSTWVARYNVAAAGSYYVVPASSTWQSVANTIYGVNTAAAGTALQTALAGQTLATGVQLGGFPTLNLTQTVAPYYVIVSGDTWSNVTQRIYGTTDANAIAALQAFNGGITTLPAVGQRLNIASPLNYTLGGTGPAIYQRADVQDALGLTTTYLKDSAGRLISVQTPAIGGSSIETRYTYDATTGNVATMTEDPTGLNRVTTFGYDANTGLLLSSRDSLGNTVTRTYNANNQLVTETSYLVRDPDGAGAGAPSSPLVKRFIYDSKNHLRFAISADGRVVENVYDSTTGVRLNSFTYAANTYSGTYDETSLASWASGQRANALQRLDYAYDFRGNVSTVTAWATTNSSGAGTGTASVTRFVYDQRGMLLSSVEARGEATSTPTNDYLTSYTYDGLGRLLTTSAWVSSTETARLVQTTSYDDVGRRVVSTFANGLTKTSIYDKDGELISVANVGSVALGTSTYTYDADGRVRVLTDATGVKSYVFYDDVGRKIGTVDGDGSLTEFIYNRAHQLIKTVRYATRLGSTTLSSLSGGTWSSVAFSTLRTEANATPTANQIARNVYDVSGALVYTIDELGAVTQNIYDGAGRSPTKYGSSTRKPLPRPRTRSCPRRSPLPPMPPIAARVSSTTETAELTGTLDGAGYLKENVYDAAGRLTTTFDYYTVTNSANWLTGTLRHAASGHRRDARHHHAHLLRRAGPAGRHARRREISHGERLRRRGPGFSDHPLRPRAHVHAGHFDVRDAQECGGRRRHPHQLVHLRRPGPGADRDQLRRHTDAVCLRCGRQRDRGDARQWRERRSAHHGHALRRARPRHAGAVRRGQRGAGRARLEPDADADRRCLEQVRHHLHLRQRQSAYVGDGAAGQLHHATRLITITTTTAACASSSIRAAR